VPGRRANRDAASDHAKATAVRRRRIAAPAKPKPATIIAQDAGSGTAPSEALPKLARTVFPGAPIAEERI